MSVASREWLVRSLLVFVALSLLACGASRENLNVEQEELLGGKVAGDFAAKVAEGDALWAERADRAKLEAAIVAWEDAVNLSAEGMDQETRRKAVFDVYVKIARAYYFLSDGYIRFDSEDEDEVAAPMMATYDKGVKAAEMALYVYSPDYQKAVVTEEKKREDSISMLDKGAIPAMYWYATNLGKWALLVGLGETLGHVDAIKAMVTSVETNDPEFFHFAAYRYFGGYYTKLPFPGGDPEKANEYFTKAIEAAPNYLGTRVLYADMYAAEKANDEQLFREQLQYVLEAADDVDPELVPENAAEKRKAQRLMDNIDDRF